MLTETIAIATIADDENALDASGPVSEERIVSSYRMEALRHAWSDLTFNAEQRNVYVRYFLLIFGALTAGWGQAYINGEIRLAYVASIISIAISSLFLLMDIRNTRRIEIATKPVAMLQDYVAKKLGLPEFRMVTISHGPIRWLLDKLRLRALVSPPRILIWIGLIVSVGAFAGSAQSLSDRACPLVAQKNSSRKVPIDAAMCEVSLPVTAVIRKKGSYFSFLAYSGGLKADDPHATVTLSPFPDVTVILKPGPKP